MRGKITFFLALFLVQGAVRRSGADISRYSVGGNRIDLILDSGATSSLWWATRIEWLGLLDVAGLELQAVYGGFAREPCTGESRECVFIGRRPVTGSRH